MLTGPVVELAASDDDRSDDAYVDGGGDCGCDGRGDDEVAHQDYSTE